MARWEREEFARHQLGRRMRPLERQCFLKKKHTEDMALAEASRQRIKYSENVRAYRCDFCGEWHVGRVKPL